jgi:mono/diheme cytochrome c family protein
MKRLAVKSSDVRAETLIERDNTYPFAPRLGNCLFSDLTGKPVAMCIASIFLFSLIVYSPAASARQFTAKNSLNETQKLGRRIFQQRCGVCHTAPTITSGIYGPILYKDLVAGNEDTIKKFIQDGSSRMPGFKYGLERSEIDSIIEYLKTVPKPQKSGSPGSREQGPID